MRNKSGADQNVHRKRRLVPLISGFATALGLGVTFRVGDGLGNPLAAEAGFMIGTVTCTAVFLMAWWFERRWPLNHAESEDGSGLRSKE